LLDLGSRGEARRDGSFYTADRATDRRIVLTALAAATLVMAISLAARGVTSIALAVASQPMTKMIDVARSAGIKTACNAGCLAAN